MFGYYIEQSKKLNSGANNDTTEVEGFTTSIKGFKTKEEAQQSLQEAEREIMRTRDFVIVDSRIYEYEN